MQAVFYIFLFLVHIISTHFTLSHGIWRKNHISGNNNCLQHRRNGFSYIKGGSNIIALTREKNNNKEVKELLKEKMLHMDSTQCNQNYMIVDIPCISFSDGPDAAELSSKLLSEDGVILTSPRVRSYFV